MSLLPKNSGHKSTVNRRTILVHAKNPQWTSPFHRHHVESQFTAVSAAPRFQESSRVGISLSVKRHSSIAIHVENHVCSWQRAKHIHKPANLHSKYAGNATSCSILQTWILITNAARSKNATIVNCKSWMLLHIATIASLGPAGNALAYWLSRI